jgi:peroxiredoxin family protein
MMDNVSKAEDAAQESDFDIQQMRMAKIEPCDSMADLLGMDKEQVINEPELDLE